MKKTLLFVLCFTFLIACFSAGNFALAATASPRDGENNYVGRAFDDDFDEIIDDCATTDGYLRAKYTNLIDAGASADGAIYKAGFPTNEQGAYDYLVFVMRGSEATLSELKLGFRKNDSLPVLFVNFLDLVDPDLNKFSDQLVDMELGADYKAYVININDSLDGLYYDAESTVAADNKFLGIHLVSDTAEGTSGVLEISEVYLSKDPQTTGYVENANNWLLDSFTRSAVNQVPSSSVWWCDSSCGFNVYSTKVISGATTYVKELTEAFSASHLVLTLKGDNGEEVVKVKFDDGSFVELTTLKDTADTQLPGVTNVYANYVIDLAVNNAAGFTRVEVACETGTIYLDQVFASNLEVADELPEYPTLDADVQIYDSFDRATLGAYDAWVETNPVASENGFDYLICYVGLEKTSIVDGVLVFDNTTNPIDYFQYKSNASTRINDGSYPYVVFKVKTSDGGSLDNLRFQTLEDDSGKGPIVWGHSMLSAKGLPIAEPNQEGYQYVTEDGWTYIIVDLALNGMSTMPSGFDIYWGGEGKLEIASIFYAKDRQIVYDTANQYVFDEFDRAEVNTGNANVYWLDSAGVTLNEGALEFVTTGGYAYYRGAAPKGAFEYLVLKMKGTGGADLNTMRIEGISPDLGHVWVKSGNIKLADGSTLAIDALTEEYQEFVIDLKASGFDQSLLGIGIGYDGEGATGTLSIESIKFVNCIPYDYTVDEGQYVFDEFDRAEVNSGNANVYWLDSTGATLNEGALEFVTTGGYAYYRGAAPKGAFEYLVLKMKGTDGADLNTMRIEGISPDLSHVWVNSGNIKLADGSTLTIDALTEEYQEFIIDLKASGFDQSLLGIGIGYDGEGATGTLSIESIKFAHANTALADVEETVHEPVQLGAPSVSVSGKVLTVTGVANCQTYEVYCDGSLFATLTDELTIDLSTKSLTVGTYAFTCKAISPISATFNSAISDSASYTLSVSSIAIKEAGKIHFENGEAFAVDGLVVTKTLSDGNVVTCLASEYTVDSSAYVANTEGVYSMTVKFNNSELTASYNVMVAAAKPKSTGCNAGATIVKLIVTLVTTEIALIVFRKRKTL